MIFDDDSQTNIVGDGELQDAFEEENEIVVLAEDFLQKNPDYGVDVFEVTSQDRITIVEYAPKLFQKIRSNIISEKDLLESIIPAANFSAMHNFTTGQGKSSSFFFFSDNRKLMLKTLKPEEFDILFDEDKFLIDYYKYITTHPDSLLSRILGVYCIRAKKQAPMTFFITENMIGDDFAAIKRCWDLKGSLHQRMTKLDDQEKESGNTGMKVLKELNLIEPNGNVNLEEWSKPGLMDAIRADTELLRKNELIDYSLFLIEVDCDRKRMMAESGDIQTLVYDRD